MVFGIMWNTVNRIENTISIPGRLVKTGLTAWADIFDTLAAIPKDMKNVISHTSSEIKNVFKNAWSKGKRYQRIGNTLLSPFVALWVAVEWAVRSVVTPAANFVANTFKAWKNVISNTLRSTFGSLFSKKPVSDFRYDELKTANVIEKNKNWFSKMRLSRRVFQNNEQRVSNPEPQPQQSAQPSQPQEPVQPVQPQEPVQPQPVQPNQPSDTNEKEEANETREPNQAENTNDGKTKNESKNKKGSENAEGSEDKKENKNEKEEKNTKENENWNNGKDAKWSKNTEESGEKQEKTQEKKEEKATEWSEKAEKKEETEKNEAKEEKKENADKPAETVQQNSEHKWVSEAKAILSNSTCGKIIIDRLCENHKDFWIIFDNSTSMGRCNEDHTITIWTQMPNGITALAPFNWKAKNPDFQKRHLLLHELSHGVIYSHANEIPGIQEWLDLIQQHIEERKDIDWRTLSVLSYRNDVYRTSKDKSVEDFVEMLALRMDWNWNLCRKYLNLLSNDKYQKFRDRHWLVTISREEANKLQNIFDSIVHFYENL